MTDADFIAEIKKAFKAADADRLQETHAAHDEAEKWKSEDDMYGWNFHEGRSAGITWASIIFHRVLRMIEKREKESSRIREQIAMDIFLDHAPNRDGNSGLQ